MGTASVTATQGVQVAMRYFERSAAAVSGAVAQMSTESADQPSTSSDLIDGMIGMNLASVGVKANVAVLRTADEMLGTLLDMRA